MDEDHRYYSITNSHLIENIYYGLDDNLDCHSNRRKSKNQEIHTPATLRADASWADRLRATALILVLLSSFVLYFFI